MPEKLKMHSPDVVASNIDRIAELFPNCVTEAAGADGRVTRKIDFDLLRQELSDQIVEGPLECYHLNWPGKREAMLAANAPIAKTLRPCREESVNFDTTRNLFIEGDNLEALKLLQETYLGKVKMIYIDPPYNTGNDFVYNDDFSSNSDEYLLSSRQIGSGAERLVANKDSSGRFHSAWLSMMSSRLKVAQRLLKDNGVLFVSIDDGEVSNLRKLCDEIFGEQNFIVQIIWKKRSTPPNDKHIGAQHDYILAYGRKYSSQTIKLRERSPDQTARYTNPDNHPKGPWAAGDLMANVRGGRYVDSLYFAITNPQTGEEHFPSQNGNWRFNKSKIDELLSNDEIYFGAAGTGRPKLKRFLSEVKEGVTWSSLWDFAPLNTRGSTEMEAIFGNSSVFENPKPVGLVELLVSAGAEPNAIVMDFFAGSSTTAEAVIRRNLASKLGLRFIMVQLPESCKHKPEAVKAGYATIADISKDRIRKSIKKITDGDPPAGKNQDLGFRVLKIDSSNMKDVYYLPSDTSQAMLSGLVNNIQPDRTGEDLLFQVLLDCGIDLGLPIRAETVEGCEVFFVGGFEHAAPDLAACFDSEVPESLIKIVAAKTPLRAVFRDSCFATDADKINVEQIFKQMSPNTQLKSL